MAANKLFFHFCNKNNFINYKSIFKCSFGQSCSRYSCGVIEERLGFVTSIGIDTPDGKNIITEDIYSNLTSALVKFEKDDTQTVATIFGTSGNFCSGASSEIALDCKALIGKCKKPIVAGISGYATGFGFELALMCDLRVVEDTAQLGLNAFPTKLSTEAYESLVSIVGVGVALDLALTGRNVSGKDAFLLRLSNRLVEVGTATGQAYTLAKWVGKYPITNLVAAKSSVYSAAGL